MKKFKQQSFDFIFALFVYIILFYSIFDVYYTSPLVRGMRPIPINIKAPTTHLIFIVSDGLRADKLFDDKMENTPFLRDVLLNRGTWGLSHTRVPTESRPAHVAMLAGFYEDVASVTKGWQANPVEFDTILNRSARAWSVGNLELVLSLAPARTAHVKSYGYPQELSDVARKTLMATDQWTVDRFMQIIQDDSEEFFTIPQPSEDLNFNPDARRGTFVFLHLDTADYVGHVYKPKSSEYVEVLRHVDQSVAHVYHTLEQKSKGTGARFAYIFTADHGMTEWGSHGAGSLHETLTPLIVWGSGIVGPTQDSPDSKLSQNPNRRDRFGLPVHNYGRLRREIQQADLCPLMASLLGLPIPVNSVGKVPSQFLNMTLPDKLKLVQANCLQILAQLEIKRQQKFNSHLSLLFKDYPLLTPDDIPERETQIQHKIKSGQIKQAIADYEQLIDLALDAFSYYHKYDRFFLGCCVASTYLLWSVVILCRLVGPVDQSCGSITKATRSTSVIWNGITLVALFLMGFVLFFALFFGLLFLGCLSCFVWGFFYRYLLSIGCLIVALWPWLDSSFGPQHPSIRRIWPFACLGLSTFPLLPVIGSSNYPFFVFLSGMSFGPVAVLLLGRISCLAGTSQTVRHVGSPKSTIWLAGILTLCIVVASSSVWCMNSWLWSFEWLRIPVHLFSWSFVVLYPMGMITLIRPHFGIRVVGWTFAFAIPLLLMSSYYEVLFFAVFAAVGYLWIYLESPTPNMAQIFFLVISFFGTGNIASVNSFDPRTAFCFTTYLNPAVMSILLSIKVLCPMLFLGLIYAAVQFISHKQWLNKLHAEPTQPILGQTGLTAVMANVIAIHFFALLRDEGSWLDIGTSISHYVISMVISLAAFLFSILGRQMLSYTLLETNVFEFDSGEKYL